MNTCYCGTEGFNCREGRDCPIRLGYLDAKAGAQRALDADQLLAMGSMTGPHRRTKPVKRGPVRRFFRALLDMLMSPRAPRI